jgi:hypothetical protein
MVVGCISTFPPTGGKLWRLAYSFGGKQKTLSFGSCLAVNLKDARQKREGAKEQLAARNRPWRSEAGHQGRYQDGDDKYLRSYGP